MYLNPLATIGKKVDIPQTIHSRQPPKCQHGKSIQFKKQNVTKTLHIQETYAQAYNNKMKSYSQHTNLYPQFLPHL